MEKIKNTFYIQEFFFIKSHPFLDNIEDYGTARQATDDNIIRRMQVACWINKATHTPTLGKRYIYSANYFSTAKKISRRASVLRDTCIACIVTYFEVWKSQKNAILLDVECNLGEIYWLFGRRKCF
jgi:hypothetical protein